VSQKVVLAVRLCYKS